MFVGILSVIFLGRRFVMRQWSGIGFIIVGLVIVGASDFLASGAGGDNAIYGDMLIVAAQIITAIQMVYEEKYVNSNDIPALQAVGWEGFFGFTVLSLLLLPMYFIHVPFADNAHGVIEDLPGAFAQIVNNKLLVVAISGLIFSIAFFNFAGISVTKELSATTRMVLDSLRTFFIWGISVALGWQNFYPLQILGFVSLLFGMCLYNNIVFPQLWQKIRSLCSRENNDEMTEPIIDQPAEQA